VKIGNGAVTLNVQTAGDESAPPLLMMHGITSSRRSWDWFVPWLSDRYRVLSLDFRGHGSSGRAPNDYQPSTYVTDAVAVLEQVGPAILIGHSLGAVTAAALSQQRPDLVKAMVLEDPPLGSMTVDDAASQSNVIMQAFRMMRASIPMAQAAGMQPEALAQMMAMTPTATGATMGQVVIPEAIVAMAAGLLDLDVSVLDPILEGTSTTAFDPSQPIPVRTLLLTGDPAMPDTVAIPSDVAPVLAKSPSVEHHVVAGAGHLIHEAIASRDEFVRLVEEYLARV
jgi:pimeloyl-ACP methyl ester carboxylesterase